MDRHDREGIFPDEDILSLEDMNLYAIMEPGATEYPTGV
jgi:hypothetical protein